MDHYHQSELPNENGLFVITMLSGQCEHTKGMIKVNMMFSYKSTKTATDFWGKCSEVRSPARNRLFWSITKEAEHQNKI